MSEWDDYWALDDLRFPAAENLVFLAICLVILVSTFFALIAPQQGQNAQTTMDVRIISTPRSVERQAVVPEEKSEGQQLSQPVMPQNSESPERPEPPGIKPVSSVQKAKAERSASKLDLSLPGNVHSYVQFGVAPKSPKSNIRLGMPSRGIDIGKDDTSSSTYESYVNSYGETEVRISDRCTMVLDSGSVLSDGDGSSVALVRCGKRNRKKDIDRLFDDIRVPGAIDFPR